MTIRPWKRTTARTRTRVTPIYWYSVILLNYAEAKAELGTLTQDDLNKSVNLLQDRVNMPHLTVNPEADPENNAGVSNLIWEVRRIRRCELMLDNWFRYWDLVRWHMLDKLDFTKYPKVNQGAHIGDGQFDVTTVNGYIQATTADRKFDKKYYLYPIPAQQITLNPAIKQNYGWTE